MAAKRRQNGGDNSHSKRARKLYDQQSARAEAVRERAVNAAREAAAITGPDVPEAASDDDHAPAGDDDTDHNDTPFVPDPYMLGKLEECLLILTRTERTVRKNICITGPAGTGKSWLVRSLAKALENLGNVVAVVAATGTAALNVEGRTCDSFLRLCPDLRKLPLQDLITKVDEHDTRASLQRLNVLILDEISMVSNEFMMQMDAIFKEARNSSEPFGGVRVVVVGDFAQLPPVKPQQFCHVHGLERFVKPKRRGLLFCRGCEREASRDGSDYNGVHVSDMWAFRAPVWNQLRLAPVLLTKLLRQTDEKLKQIVVSLFMGKELTTAQVNSLKIQTDVSASSIRLFYTRVAAEEHNKECRQELDHPETTFTALDNWSENPNHRHLKRRSDARMDPGTFFLTMLKDHKLPEKLTLCTGMPVVLLTNINVMAGLVNGSQGTITGWRLVGSEDIPRISDGMLVSGLESRSSQRTQAGYLPSVMNDHWTRRQNRVRAFMSDERNNGKPLPVVTFSNGVEHIIYPLCASEDWAYEDDVSTFIRTQIPLLPAWALTIHRAQGMTLASYVADLSGAFCTGLEYVALSRGPSLEKMEVRGLRSQLRHKMDPAVAKFMKDTYPDLEEQMEQAGRAPDSVMPND